MLLVARFNWGADDRRPGCAASVPLRVAVPARHGDRLNDRRTRNGRVVLRCAGHAHARRELQRRSRGAGGMGGGQHTQRHTSSSRRRRQRRRCGRRRRRRVSSQSPCLRACCAVPPSRPAYPRVHFSVGVGSPALHALPPGIAVPPDAPSEAAAAPGAHAVGRVRAARVDALRGAGRAAGRQRRAAGRDADGYGRARPRGVARRQRRARVLARAALGAASVLPSEGWPCVAAPRAARAAKRARAQKQSQILAGLVQILQILCNQLSYQLHYKSSCVYKPYYMAYSGLIVGL